MRVFRKNQFRKSCGGAIMFQVLLGIGLMVLMSPIVFQQIKKYNEDIHREEVVADMEKLQKAASSFVMFEKETSKIPDGMTIWRNDNLSSALHDYLGGSGLPHSPNGFGQEYSIITLKNENGVDGAVVASCVSSRCINDVTLNGIGQFLFDRGAIIASDGEVLSDLKLSDELKAKLQDVAHDTKAGLLVMFISDAYFTSDYLHIEEMPGESSRAVLFNTMLVDLQMDGGGVQHNLNDVNLMYGNDLKVSGSSNLGVVSVNTLTLASESYVHGDVEYKRNNGLLMLNGSRDIGLVAESELYFNNLKVSGEMKVGSIDIDTSDMTLAGSIDVSLYNVLGDANVIDWEGNMPVGGINFVVANIVNSTGNKTDEVGYITMIDQGSVGKSSYSSSSSSDGSSDGFIYVGEYTETSSGDKSYAVQPAILNLAGTSEVKDICIASVCLSKLVVDTVSSVNKALSCYLGYTHGSDTVNVGNIEDCND